MDVCKVWLQRFVAGILGARLNIAAKQSSAVFLQRV